MVAVYDSARPRRRDDPLLHRVVPHHGEPGERHAHGSEKLGGDDTILPTSVEQENLLVSGHRARGGHLAGHVGSEDDRAPWIEAPTIAKFGEGAEGSRFVKITQIIRQW